MIDINFKKRKYKLDQTNKKNAQFFKQCQKSHAQKVSSALID